MTRTRPASTSPVLLSVVGLVALVYGITHAGQTGRWTAPGALGFIVVGTLVLAGFIQVKAHSGHAALELSWFRRPVFSVATAAIGATFFAMFGMLLIGMYYLQFHRGYSLLGAGMLMLGNAVAAGVTAPLSVRLAARHGTRVVCAGGLGLLAVTFVFMATWTHTTPVGLVALGAGVAVSSAARSASRCSGRCCPPPIVPTSPRRCLRCPYRCGGPPASRSARSGASPRPSRTGCPTAARRCSVRSATRS